MVPLDSCMDTYSSSALLSSGPLGSSLLPALSVLSSVSSSICELPLSPTTLTRSRVENTQNHSQYVPSKCEWKTNVSHSVPSSSTISLPLKSSQFPIPPSSRFSTDESIYEHGWTREVRSPSSPRLEEFQHSQDSFGFLEAGRGSWSTEVDLPFDI